VQPFTPGADADKRILRLKEVFKERISEFREAVHVLFGYRIDMSDQRCRLLSQYSSSPKDVLLFDLKRNERGVLGRGAARERVLEEPGPRADQLFVQAALDAGVCGESHDRAVLSANIHSASTGTTALLSEQQ
jgi:hypothetical protein